MQGGLAHHKAFEPRVEALTTALLFYPRRLLGQSSTFVPPLCTRHDALSILARGLQSACTPRLPLVVLLMLTLFFFAPGKAGIGTHTGQTNLPRRLRTDCLSFFWDGLHRRASLGLLRMGRATPTPTSSAAPWHRPWTRCRATAWMMWRRMPRSDGWALGSSSHRP